MLTIRLRSAFRVTFPVIALLLLFELSALASGKVMVLLSSLNLWFSAQELLLSIVAFALINIPLILAEWLWPGTTSSRRYLEGAKFLLVFLVVTYCWSKAAHLLSGKLQLQPFFVWKIQNDSGGAAHTFVIALGTLVTVWTYDFFYYWFHRAQHHFPMLWRVHRVHIRSCTLIASTTYHHAFEEMLRFPFITIPLAVLLKVDVPQLVLLSAFVAAWGQYIHSDTRVHLGKLSPVFADNAHHRIHHAVLERHFNKNFAVFFPVWDRLFGTYEEPQRGCGLFAAGLAHTPPPRTVSDYLLMPFRQAQRTEGSSKPHNTAFNPDART